MEQFAAIAAAHFLAMLIPGVDFFLIVRTAVTNGWRNATGVCFGIAAAHGILIFAAFSSVSLITNPLLLSAIRLAGGAFLIFVGVSFLTSRERIEVDNTSARRRTWLKNFGLGITSALLNPKNALFYASLAAAVGNSPPAVLALYWGWMFTSSCSGACPFRCCSGLGVRWRA